MAISGVSSLVRVNAKSLPVLISMMLFCDVAFGQDRAQLGRFEQTIRPLLMARCIECHGPDRQESKLRLDSRSGWMKGGERGPAIHPNDPASSLLLHAVKHLDPDLRMPEEKLSDAEIAALENWIREGAVDPRETSDVPASFPS